MQFFGAEALSPERWAESGEKPEQVAFPLTHCELSWQAIHMIDTTLASWEPTDTGTLCRQGNAASTEMTLRQTLKFSHNIHTTGHVFHCTVSNY